MTTPLEAVSEERLRDIVSKYSARPDDYVPAVLCSELVKMATELLALRSSGAVKVKVTAGDLQSFAESVHHIEEGDFYADYDRATAALGPLRRILAALSSIEPAEQEPGHEYTATEIAQVYGADIIERMRIPDKWHDYIRLTIEQAVDHDRQHTASPASPEAEKVTVTDELDRIVAHVERYDTPAATDQRRRYTKAQLETAIRLALTSAQRNG